MIDAIVKDAICQALVFLSPGSSHEAVINEHRVVWIKRRDDGAYAVACLTCNCVLSDREQFGRPQGIRGAFMDAHRHIAANRIDLEEAKDIRG